MKLKLAGLLVFSQSASAISAVDKNNYRQHLCDDRLFKPVPVIFEGAMDTGMFAQLDRHNIKEAHAQYCYTKSHYEESLDMRVNKFGSVTCPGEPDSKGSKNDCIVRAGIAYAQACEKAKQSKADSSKQRAWNEVTPTLESCNNARLR